jgi:hypothetical protein
MTQQRNALHGCLPALLVSLFCWAVIFMAVAAACKVVLG